MKTSLTFGLSLVSMVLLAACGGDTAATDTAAASDSATAAAPAAIDGEQIYNRYCFSCHAAGIAGAPKHADLESWKPRLAKGRELLLQSIVDGMPPGMPPRGACIGCSDAELEAVLDYMLEAVEDPS